MSVVTRRCLDFVLIIINNVTIGISIPLGFKGNNHFDELIHQGISDWEIILFIDQGDYKRSVCKRRRV